MTFAQKPIVKRKQHKFRGISSNSARTHVQWMLLIHSPCSFGPDIWCVVLGLT